ncbi:MAG: MFS transporter [Cyanobacteria bacterium HKST-UBA06]|nr:MFS transporter [Cyanobacteria bacterium HKST-UBA06]MCA9842425.1 MFS transporter [Cyanobacteria bacterium HKST-UBA03]
MIDADTIEPGKARSVLFANTIAFATCFACWMVYGVLITFLVENGLYRWNASQIGMLIGIPVLTGSIMRLPVGIWTDQFGGRIIFAGLMLLAAVAMYFVGSCDTYMQFLLAGLGFGLCGASFAVGIAYTSLWFPKEKQGTALGIFGAGNAGAALTSMGAPHLLKVLTDHGQNLEGWRMMPKIYAAALVVMTLIYWFLTHPKKVEHGRGFTMAQRLSPLKDIRVWRFGLYYFFVFGGFVALAQWLVPYYVNVYAMPLAMAGMMAAIFSLPSGVIRALGGWMSDVWGARFVMYMVLIACLVSSILLTIPRMDIESPGQGVTALKSGTVVSVNDQKIVLENAKDGVKEYSLRKKNPSSVYSIAQDRKEMVVWPTFAFWQEPVVKVGDVVEKKQLLARGVTHIFFQANVWIFTILVFVIGVMTGIGKAAVYKHIPDYFPKDVGVVGGIVGVLGGLGGFVGPMVFGYLLQLTGIWTTCWLLFTGLISVCLFWMHWVITKMVRQKAPELLHQIDDDIKHAIRM